MRRTTPSLALALATAVSLVAFFFVRMSLPPAPVREHSLQMTSVIDRSSDPIDESVFGRTSGDTAEHLADVAKCPPTHRCFDALPTVRMSTAITRLGSLPPTAPSAATLALRRFLAEPSTRCSADVTDGGGTLLCVGRGSSPLLFYRHLAPD